MKLVPIFKFLKNMYKDVSVHFLKGKNGLVMSYTLVI